MAALNHLIGLYAAEGIAKKAVKEAQIALDSATLQRYGQLSQDEVKRIVLDEKWAGAMQRRVGSEVNGLTLELVARLQELGERYAETLTELADELSIQEGKVARHLAEMGIR